MVRAVSLLALVVLALGILGSVAEVGAYDEAGHFYTATWVLANRSPDTTARRRAALMAFCAQLPDLVGEFDAVTLRVGVMSSWSGSTWGAFSSCSSDDVNYMVSVHRYLHGLIGERDNDRKEIDASRLTGAAMATLAALEDAGDDVSVCAAGFAIHLLGDSYAHRQLAQPPDKPRMYETGRGHLEDGNHPDYIFYVKDNASRSGLWESYSRNLSATLKLSLPQAELATIVAKRVANVATRLSTGNYSASYQYDDDTMRENLADSFGRGGAATEWNPYSPPVETLSAPPKWSWTKPWVWAKGVYDYHILQWQCSEPGKPNYLFGEPTYQKWRGLDCRQVWSTFVGAAATQFKAANIPEMCPVTTTIPKMKP